MRAVVIGVGNRYRGDDGAGAVVAERVARLGMADVVVTEADGEPTRLLDAWEGAPLAIVIDAVRTGTAPAGAVHRIEGPVQTASAPGSSHALGLGDSYALGRALGRLPRRLVIYGIEGETFATGAELSRPVSAAIEGVVAAIAAELDRSRSCA